MARYHVRCAKRSCDTRRVLAKHPDEYVRVPKCTGCGGTKYYLSHWMNRRDTRKTSCTCPGYIHVAKSGEFPHRMGSKYCHYRKDGSLRMPGDADFNDVEFEQYVAESKQFA